MKQVFVDQDCQLHSRIYLDEQQAHHLFDVLRIQKKEVVRLFSPSRTTRLSIPF